MQITKAVQIGTKALANKRAGTTTPAKSHSAVSGRHVSGPTETRDKQPSDIQVSGRFMPMGTSEGATTMPILAELIPRGDGTYLLKQKLVDGRMETWISPQKASKLLGLKIRSVYRLLDSERPLLVHKRPLRKKILVSLKSVQSYIEATRDPDFWSDPLQRRALEQEVSTVMNSNSRMRL